MAIRWDWNEKCGEAIISQEISGTTREYTLSLYQGNCYLIFMNEWVEDGLEKYSLHSFWADPEHMKACLGISKKSSDKYNMYDDGITKLTKIRLNKKKCRYIKGIVSALIDAFNDIIIELYTEKEEEN
jgi:hypothetical protein